MAPASLADCLSPVVDDHVVAAALEVVDESCTNLGVGLLVVDHDDTRDEIMCCEQRIELPQLVAEVADLLSIDGNRLSENLSAGLRPLVDHVVLRETRHRRVKSARQIAKVVGMQAAAIAG